MKWLRRALILILLLALLVAAALWWTTRRALPQIEGSLSLAGLKRSNTAIISTPLSFGSWI